MQSHEWPAPLLTPVGSTWKTNLEEIYKDEWSPQNWEMHLQRRISQHYVSWLGSHRTVTCKHDVVWKAWYCPNTVYCRRISLIFSEVISPKNPKQHRMTSSLKGVTACITTCGISGINSVSEKQVVFLKNCDSEVLPTNVNKILMNTVIFPTLKRINSNVDS